MNRRKFLAATVTATGVTLAGCSGGEADAPPRNSNVFDNVTLQNGQIMIDLAGDPNVTSRADIGIDNSNESNNSNSLAPIGVAEAKGRGASGRGRSSGGRSGVPRGRTRGGGGFAGGWFIFYGGNYGGWRDNHQDEVNRYLATISQLAVGRMGDLSDKNDSLPGPGAIEWDKTWNNPQKQQYSYKVPRNGWYRVGVNLNARNAQHDFGWEATDMKIKGNNVQEQWKVSPRL